MKYFIILLSLIILNVSNVFSRGINWYKWEEGHNKYREYVKIASEHNKIDTNLIEAIICWETNWKPNRTSVAGARGLMQVIGKPRIGFDVNDKNRGWSKKRWHGKKYHSYDPYENILAGSFKYNRYRKIMQKWFENKGYDLSDEDLEKVTLTAYNRGCGGARTWYRTRMWKVSPEVASYGLKHPTYTTAIWAIFIDIEKVKNGELKIKGDLHTKKGWKQYS